LGKQFSRGEIKNSLKFPKYKPFFSRLLSDGEERIFVRQFETPWNVDEVEEYEYDTFNKEGYFLYILKLSKIIDTLKNGYLYRVGRDQETDYRSIERKKSKTGSR
jgi:hypothetical protein